MDEFIVLKPARTGDVVRDPKSQIPLPPEGKAVRRSTFWNRRLAQGDVVEVKQTKKSAGAGAQGKDENK